MKAQDDEASIIQVVLLPELYLLTGPANTIYKGLFTVWQEVKEWLKTCNGKHCTVVATLGTAAAHCFKT